MCIRSVLDQSYQEWELIIVNDGSTDRTGEIADSFAARHGNVLVLHHFVNFHIGQCFRFAIKHCRGDYVITMDIDLSYSPDHIGTLLRAIRETKAKIVIASPYMKGGKVSNVPWIRKKLSKYANKFLSLVVTRDPFSDRLTTLTGMVRAYDGEFIRNLDLKAMDVDICTEIIYTAMILRARIVEIPAHLNWAPSQKTKNGHSASSTPSHPSVSVTTVAGPIPGSPSMGKSLISALPLTPKYS